MSTSPERERRAAAIVLQREIRETRAELVADIDRLRGAVRERVSLQHVLRTHPQLRRAIALALAFGGVATLTLLWAATSRLRRRDAA